MKRVCIVCFFVPYITMYALGLCAAQGQIKHSVSGALRSYSEDGETLLLSPSFSGSLRYSDDMLVQKKTDALKRLVQKTVWKKGESEPVLLTTYTYQNDSPFPSYSETQDKAASRITGESYNEKGNLIKREVYEKNAAEADGKNSDTQNNGEKKRLVFSETLSYDSTGRLSERFMEFFDSVTRTEKTKYRYKKGGKKADVFYYRNGEKIKQSVYRSADDWEETLFFPGDIQIISVYRDGTAVSETVYENGVKKRERSFAQNKQGASL